MIERFNLHHILKGLHCVVHNAKYSQRGYVNVCKTKLSL